MDIQAYLDRIGYHGPLTPTAETLRALQVAHLQTVPFENLSIHAGQPIVLDDGSLFGKVVERRRGGFCYELNGLFAALLRALGFQVAMLSARVARADGTFNPAFDHMTLAVTLEERWLADAGFGDSFREPLRLDERGEQPEGVRAFRIDEAGGHHLLLRRDGPGLGLTKCPNCSSKRERPIALGSPPSHAIRVFRALGHREAPFRLSHHRRCQSILERA